ncbi:MAG: hypothetical protein ACPIOQ_62295, partial [Promethearchaeia archaeon]
MPPAISTLCLHGTEASHATRDEQKGGAEERDALLHNGEHMSASLAAELDSYLVQVLVRCGMAPCVFTPVDTASPRCVRAAISTCSPAAVHLTACDVSVLIRMRQLSEANESMGRCLRDMGSSGDSARLMHVLQRHRELLHEYEKECRKIKANIKEQRERDELLHSVRRDIGEFKTAAASRTDSLVRERASTTNSLKTTDQLLKGAAATYESLKNQRQFYNSIA